MRRRASRSISPSGSTKYETSAMCTWARYPEPSRATEMASSKSRAVSGSMVKVGSAVRSRRPRSGRVARPLTAAASSSTALEKPWRTPLAWSRARSTALTSSGAAEDLDDPAPVAVRRHGEHQVVQLRRHPALGHQIRAHVREEGLERPELAPAGDAVRERATEVLRFFRSPLGLAGAACLRASRRTSASAAPGRALPSVSRTVTRSARMPRGAHAATSLARR